MKLKDVSVPLPGIYRVSEGSLYDGEEVRDAGKKPSPFFQKDENSVLLLDGYTGFTPIQMRVVGELLAVCKK